MPSNDHADLVALLQLHAHQTKHGARPVDAFIIELFERAIAALSPSAPAEAEGASDIREQAKDLYAEGLSVGIRLGRAGGGGNPAGTSGERAASPGDPQVGGEPSPAPGTVDVEQIAQEIASACLGVGMDYAGPISRQTIEQAVREALREALTRVQGGKEAPRG